MARTTLRDVVQAFIDGTSAHCGALTTDGNTLRTFAMELAKRTDDGEIVYSTDRYAIARGYGGYKTIANVGAKMYGKATCNHQRLVREMLGNRRINNTSQTYYVSARPRYNVAVDTN